MSSENHPVRKAWIRRARGLILRRWLTIALAAALVISIGFALWPHHRAGVQSAAVTAVAQPATPAANAATAQSTQPKSAPTTPAVASPAPPSASSAAGGASTPPPAAANSALALRLAPAGDKAFLLTTPSVAPAPPTAPPAPAAPTTPPSPNQSAPDLPTVAVGSPGFHVVPSDRDTQRLGTVTMSERNARTFTIAPAKPPPAPERTASASAPTSAPAVHAEDFAPVASAAVFSGHARVTGPLTLNVQGQQVQLFGVALAPAQDRCAAPNGAAQSCAALAQAELTQKLSGHSIVACRVPPEQRGALNAICLDEQGNDLGRFLVVEGLALADSTQGYDYLLAQGAARSAKRGLWRFR